MRLAQPSMVPLKFDKVWYLPQENRWRDMNMLAYRDTGQLVLQDKSMEFRGKKETVIITRIQSVSCGRQRRDFVNNWVRVEYGEGRRYRWPTLRIGACWDGAEFLAAPSKFWKR